MSGWLEVYVAGDCRAFVESGHIKGVIAASGLSGDEMASASSPLTLIMASGETLEGVYGVSATRLLFRIWAVREYMRQKGKTHVVVYLDNAEGFDAQLASLMPRGPDIAETS